MWRWWWELVGGGLFLITAILKHEQPPLPLLHLLLSSPSLLSLPPPSLPLFSPGIPFPCVIRLLIKAVDVERMNAHCRHCLSLCVSLCMESASYSASLQRKDSGLAPLTNYVFCVFNIELWFGVFSLLMK